MYPQPAPEISIVLLASDRYSRLKITMARLRDQSAKRDPLAGLSAQERKILELIGEGLTNRQIGERMFLAEKTVKNYVSALFAKLGMERRTQAAAYAVRAFDDQRDQHDPYHGPAS